MPVNYVRIPEPASASEMYKIASFSVPEGGLEFFWWFAGRTVLLLKTGSWYVWNGHPDTTIIETLRNALDLPANQTVHVDSLFEHEGTYACPLSDDLISAFPTCAWSDYSCDRMVISGAIKVVASGRNRGRSVSFDNT